MDLEELSEKVNAVKAGEHVELPLKCLVTFVVEYDGHNPLVIRKGENYNLRIRTLNVITRD